MRPRDAPDLLHVAGQPAENAGADPDQGPGAVHHAGLVAGVLAGNGQAERAAGLLEGMQVSLFLPLERDVDEHVHGAAG